MKKVESHWFGVWPSIYASCAETTSYPVNELYIEHRAVKRVHQKIEVTLLNSKLHTFSDKFLRKILP